jgi:DNA-directed RNA polymerase specialized sigma24 family protein
MISRPYGDDEAALAAASRGESAGLLQLFDSYAPLLFGVGQRILGDRGLAEEVLHDVFLEIWARAGDYRPTGATIRVWLLVHLRARALDRLRARVGKMVSLEDTQLALCHERARWGEADDAGPSPRDLGGGGDRRVDAGAGGASPRSPRLRGFRRGSCSPPRPWPSA